MDRLVPLESGSGPGSVVNWTKNPSEIPCGAVVVNRKAGPRSGSYGCGPSNGQAWVEAIPTRSRRSRSYRLIQLWGGLKSEKSTLLPEIAPIGSRNRRLWTPRILARKPALYFGGLFGSTPGG